MRPREEGYTLVALIVAFTIMSVVVAAALPLWSYRIRRDRDEEAIFRGLQYAEAIRVFQSRFGRYPVRLEELVEVEPRSIRQLWKDPLSDDGEFGLIVEAPREAAGGRRGLGGQVSGGAGDRPAAEPAAVTGRPAAGSELAGATRGTADTGGAAEGQAGGGSGGAVIRLPRRDEDGEPIENAGLPIRGVYVDLEGEATRLFFGERDYAKWDFTADLIQLPQVVADRPVPRVRSDWIGKPFPERLQSGDGSAPSEAAAGTAPESAADRGGEGGLDGARRDGPGSAAPRGLGETVEDP
ncbi:MAG: type II secretion system protein, partial [Thermoanaerobaculia bacterium]|nr:type II secretion system protein [Thermoanaerobaculia bacterium]